MLSRELARTAAITATLLTLPSSKSTLVSSFTMAPRQLHHRRFIQSSSNSPRRQFVVGAQLLAHDDENGETSVHGRGTASIPNLTTSLVKSIVGSGVLALPAGVATLGDSPSAKIVVPVILLIIIIGMINAYFFSLIGRVCHKTGATGYREAWELTMGEETSQWVAIAVAFKTALTCLAFSIIIADSFQSLAIAAGLDHVTRTEALGAVTLCALLPLCLLRDLTSLAPFSLLGLAGMTFTTGVMLIRYLDGSYAVDTGRFLSQVSTDLQPSFGDSRLNPDGMGCYWAPLTSR
jgi:hypothetical protein